ncbi:GNAT family N-acetyltransferase [Flavobacterium sp. DG1-102-2]|uniref:GNAT family N-acetyltransferase n=1 Tax=Flavobacterium sp. DG1-102-2 TaxID=3081663 RepID=UPI002949EF60|nr:GNAT family N-acetyltransferase [Flavobacterium sp. DG1-102-2]MDV6167879.1 GNAT family N-acetyltransferase [Flavobacterium sp. DG1-102-2]
MVTLTGNTIYLRALEPDDLEFIYRLENNEAIWEVSNTQTPYSRFLIRQYLENSHQDIYEAKQLRLAICKTGTFDAIGLIDLFDFDPVNQRAGVGIIIQDTEERNLGVGTQALGLLISYAFNKLQLHQLYANIDSGNVASVSLFTNFGFQLIGQKKDWIKRNNNYHDEGLYQLISQK